MFWVYLANVESLSDQSKPSFSYKFYFFNFFIKSIEIAVDCLIPKRPQISMLYEIFTPIFKVTHGSPTSIKYKYFLNVFVIKIMFLGGSLAINFNKGIKHLILKILKCQWSFKKFIYNIYTTLVYTHIFRLTIRELLINTKPQLCYRIQPE